MQSDFASVEEISNALIEQGVTPPSGLASIRAAVIRDWNLKTDYVPFLGAANVTEHTYDPPFKIRDFTLDLGGGFWQVDSVALNGTVLTAGTDYDLLPLDAANLGRGWDKLRFRNHPGYAPSSIVIEGKRGYAENLPDDVYEATSNEMCRRAVAKSQDAIASDLQEIKQGPVTIKLEGSGFRWRGADDDLDELALLYLRI